ncbi:MAG: BrnT family toxin [Anaerolineae bacterium]|nr:BrnT family toxin [Anaerolineae bacterium]
MRLIFEWDENKAKANLKKHKVSFDEAKTIFSDPAMLTFPDDDHSQSEERFLGIGISAKSRLLLVVLTERGENIIRIISCRKATILEREAYEGINSN